MSELLTQSNRSLMAAKRAGKGRSMSYQEMIAAETAAVSPTIDWEELAEVGVARSADTAEIDTAEADTAKIDTAKIDTAKADTAKLTD